MFALDRIVQGLNDQDLKKGYTELIDLNFSDTGILIDGIVRECYRKTVEEIPGYPFSINSLEKTFLYEIARRHYKQSE